MMKILFLLLTIMLVAVIGRQKSHMAQQGERNVMAAEDVMTRKATFAGGCFWCVEADFEKIPGIVKVISGYTFS